MRCLLGGQRGEELLFKGGLFRENNMVHTRFIVHSMPYYRKTQIGDYEVEQIRTARYIGPEKVRYWFNPLLV